MKKTPLFIVISLFLGLYGCGNKMIETETFCSERMLENDSVNFSTKICIEFVEKGKRAVVDFINSTLVSTILEVDFDGTRIDAINRHIDVAFADYQSSKTVPAWEFYEYIDGFVTFLNEDYLCYQYNLHEYRGGTHPLEKTIYLVFDLKTGKKLTEDEIFTPDGKEDFWQILTEILSDTQLYPENKTYKLNNIALNGNFSFEQDTLIYTFNQYEIAPYSSGKIDVKIPYEKIKEIIKIDLSQLLK